MSDNNCYDLALLYMPVWLWVYMCINEGVCPILLLLLLILFFWKRSLELRPEERQRTDLSLGLSEKSEF